MAKSIEEIDKNLQVKKELDVTDCKFYDVRKAPFKIYGLCSGEEKLRRVPEKVAQSAETWGVKVLSENTSGGRVRFKTNSEYVAIRCVMSDISRFSHMPLTGSSGFDMYVSENGKDKFEKTFVPPYDMTDGYSAIHHFGTRKMREIMINFPPYNTVDALYMGIEEEAIAEPGREYAYTKPVVYYGSSVTQGGCASRPGNTYPALISQMLDCDYINLGFSGTRMGEDAVVEYIKGLDMSVFVYDFDYNAPDIEYLEKMHEKVFKEIRKEQPELPVIMLSAASNTPNFESMDKTREVVLKTYENAVSAGDKNVFFIDGGEFYAGEFSSSCTVDYVHPSDAGFLRMASVIGKYVKRVLE